MAPEAYALDSALLARPGNDEIQLDLLLDYGSNVALYPKFQEYFRARAAARACRLGQERSIPSSRAGAEAFKRDIPGAEVHLYDTGHFALETHLHEIAAHHPRFSPPGRSTVFLLRSAEFPIPQEHDRLLRSPGPFRTSHGCDVSIMI